MSQKKRLLLALPILMVVAILGGIFFFQTPAILPSASIAFAAEHLTLTWAGDPQTSQTITWKTEEAARGNQIQYREAKGESFIPQDAKVLTGETEELSTNLGMEYIHSLTITGLKPGTSYLYRWGDGETWSEVHSFKTAPLHSSNFTFLVFGDSQSSNYDVWRNTLQQAYQATPQSAFFINAGDLVDVGQDYAQWKAWFAGAQGVVDQIPIMPIAGNHESYTPERKFSMPTLFTAQFKLPLNGPEGLKGQVYSFDYGDVHFSMLDSQEGEQRNFVPEMLAWQKDWLERDLAATNKKWKVVFTHRPPYNNKWSRDGGNIRSAFVPIFDKYHVDVVFSGHDHVYARTYPLYNDQVVESTEQGTVYVATGRSGTKYYHDVVSKDWNNFFYNPKEEPNYIRVEVEEGRVIISAYTQQGLLIDTWRIEKEK